MQLHFLGARLPRFREFVHIDLFRGFEYRLPVVMGRSFIRSNDAL